MKNDRKYPLLFGKIAESGLTQKQLAKALKMSATTLSSRLSGNTPFDVLEINNLCTVLNIKKDSLVTYFF